MDGKVLVAAATDRDFVPLIERACAVVVEAGGLTSHAAVVGLSMGKPTVVGAHDAMRRLASGQIVTVDGHRGLVFRGSVQV
jgi:pyruvate kinase